MPFASFVWQNRAKLFDVVTPEDVKAPTDESLVRPNRPALFERATPEDATIEAIKMLTRLYQVTPGDEALEALLELGFSSGQDIAAFSEEVFIRTLRRQVSVTERSATRLPQSSTGQHCHL